MSDANSGVFEQNQSLSSEETVKGEKESRRNCPNCNLDLPFSVRVCPNDGTDLFLSEDELFAEKYELIEEIGAGAIGTIYKARHVALDSLVAIKVLNQVTEDKKTFLRFQREAKAASKLTHPNVINVFDFGVWKDCQPYMVMDFLEGDTLDKYIGQRGQLRLDEILSIMLPVAKALDHAHGCGVLHRDLKPSNIMIQPPSVEGSRVKLLDFGLAKLLFRDDGVSLSATGAILGSPAYMSPEQATAGSVDARADIYSLGCIFYRLLTGEPPLIGDSAPETFMKRLNYGVPSLSEVCEGYIPEELDNLVSRMLERDLSKRCKSAAWVYKEILSVKNGLSDLSVQSLSVRPKQSLYETTESSQALDETVVKRPLLDPFKKKKEKSGENFIDLGEIPIAELIDYFNKQSVLLKLILILAAVLITALVTKIVLQ